MGGRPPLAFLGGISIPQRCETRCCFHQLVEQHVLTDSYKQRYGLKLWLRFKDDIFFVIDSDYETRIQFVHEVKRLSEFFVIKIETISRVQIQMLDMVVFKGPRFAAVNKLDAGAHVKRTHQGSSLSHRSGHCPSVHMAWPLSRMQHFARICSSRVETRKAQDAFESKLMLECPEHPILKVLRSSRIGLREEM